MSEDILVPSVGESITDGVLAAWTKQDGDFVEIDDPLFEFETDKVTMPVNSPFEGVLRIQTPAGSKVNVGDIVGTIDTSAQRPAAESASSAAPSRSTLPANSIPPAQSTPPPPSTQSTESSSSTPSTSSTPSAPPAAESTADDLPPSVRRLIEEHNLLPADIPGTGKGGRLTKEDVVRFMEKRAAGGASGPAAAKFESAPTTVGGAPSGGAVPPVLSSPIASSPIAPLAGDRRQTRTPMSPLRKRVAQRLVEAQQTAAMVTTYNEADLSAVLRMRDQYNDAFEKRYGIRMGFMSFFIKAAVDALKTVPSVNAQIDGDDIVENHFYDIGVAVSTEKGLVVPILRDCDRMSLAQLELAIQDFARRARERKLTLDDLAGGSFSISNGGVFGSLLSAPMLNPPQSGILGMHAIKKRPVVIDDQIVIRPMMYLALSYDHRLVDGREGVTFLKRIVECIENPERLLLEV